MSKEAVARLLSREIRRLGISQSDLARMVGVQPSVVNRWVNGERLPAPESIELIAEALNLDGDRLLVLAGHRRNREDLPEGDPRYHVWDKLQAVTWTNERELLLLQILDSMLSIDAVKAPAPIQAGPVTASWQ